MKKPSERNNSPFRRVIRKLLTLISYALLGLLAVLYVKGGDSNVSESKNSLLDCPGCNLIVILVDTLRADHLPFYGYQKDTAPFLTELSEKSSVFERAFSASSWTAPATASVFTSVMPSRHGVITGFAATQSQKRRNSTFELNRIPDSLKTLPEFAASAGFQTFGVADNLNIGKEIGFDRGFSKFTKFRYHGAHEVNKKAMEYISSADPSRPYFLYLHYMDPHEPYSRRNPWYSRCINLSSNSRKNRTTCSYDSEINYTDSKIKELFEVYDWLNNSVVIFLSDHGEEFQDHGQNGHGKTLYTEMIHVPMMIYHPAWPGRRIKRNVHTIDTLPTVAALTSRPASTVWAGRNLIPVIHRETERDGRPIISERLRSKDSRFKWAKRSVIKENYHLVKTETLEGKNLQNELYDLMNDFGEKKDISSSNKNITDQLTVLLERQIRADPADSGTVEIEADPELLRELRTLGYLE